MFRFEYRLTKLRDMRVYHDGPLTIYLRGFQLWWNFYGKLQRVDDETVNKYFELH